MSKVIYIYKIYHKNFIKYPKFYIGSTTNYLKRITSHRYNCGAKNSKKYNFKLYRYIRKHGGFSNFDYHVLNIHEYTKLTETRILEQKYHNLMKPQLNTIKASII